MLINEYSQAKIKENWKSVLYSEIMLLVISAQIRPNRYSFSNDYANTIN
jgi:hypothetical protein